MPQYKIALFAGTTEGRQLAEELLKALPEVEIDAFVVSSYGAGLLPKDRKLAVHVGRLDQSKMERLFRSGHYALILDATHPYASEVTKNLYAAADASGIPYLRVRRKEEPLTPTEKDSCVGVKDLEAAARYLKNTEGNILLTTGSKELPAFSVIPDFENRAYARMLPTEAALRAAKAVNLKGRHLILMQGPFSEEMNRALLKDTDARILVTKMSGKEGGFAEKVKAAVSLNRKVLVILPPDESEVKEGETVSLDGAIGRIREILSSSAPIFKAGLDGSGTEQAGVNAVSKNRRKFTLIGMGPGNPDLISEEVRKAIQEADTLIGSERVISVARSLVPKDDTKAFFVSFLPSEIRTYLNHHPEAKNIALLYSGSIRIYSGASSIDKIADKGDRIERIDGLSSVDYFRKVCRIPEPAELISVHGREVDAPAVIRKNRRTIVLLGGSETLQAICREFIRNPSGRRNHTADDRTAKNENSEKTGTVDVGSPSDQGDKEPHGTVRTGALKVTVAERLSYPDQRIRAGRPEDFIDARIDSLSIACFEWVPYPSVMIAAAKSGSGKTTVTCGLIRALQRRGHRMMSFKCGPDYIDPMFHASTLGVPTGNLDSFFTDEGTLRHVMRDGIEENQADLSVIEGVMGFYDGLGGTTTTASSFEVSRMTGTPVILVIDVRGASLTLAPMIEGILRYESQFETAQFGGSLPENQSAQSAGVDHSASVKNERDQVRETRKKQERGFGQTAIQGLILNRSTAGFYPVLKKLLETKLEEAGYPIPVLGYLPVNEQFTVPSRHLGLISPGELKERKQWADRIADQIEETVDLDAVERMAVSGSFFPEEEISSQKVQVVRYAGSQSGNKAAQSAGSVSENQFVQSASLHSVWKTDMDLDNAAGKSGDLQDPWKVKRSLSGPRIAVAYDEAFTFYYSENEALLKELGAEVIHFSPLHGESFPQNVQGLVLGGGYPELFLEALWKNGAMREQIRQQIEAGMPTIAECGGFMYLLDSLKKADGREYPMCGVIHGTGYETKKLVRFGYFEGVTNRDGLYGPKGMKFRGHEFHYWDATVIGDGMHLKKPTGTRQWNEIVYTNTLAAGFPHFYWPGQPEAVEHFLEQCQGV